MKKSSVIMICFFAVLGAFAQDAKDSLKLKNAEYTSPFFSLGFGTGVNNYTSLLGFSGNLKLGKKVFLQGGMGVGGWGEKYSIGLRYDLEKKTGWGFGLGYSRCIGANNVHITSTQNGIKTTNIVECLPASSINIKAMHNWVLNKRVCLYVDLGYAFPMQTNPWVVKNGSTITNFTKTVLTVLSPGGPIIATGITFGLKK